MNNSLKNYIGIAGIIGILLASWSLMRFASAFSESIQPSSFRSFSASAEGKVVAIPDVATFSFSALTQGGTNLAALQKQNTEKINKAIAFVKSKGVETKDIKTEGYSVEPRYQYYSCDQSVSQYPQPCKPADIVGYTIQQSVGVKVRNFDITGDLLAGVVENGANTVSQLTFTVDDPTALQDQARNEAIRKAQNKARQIAEAGGFNLGRLLSIDEGYVNPVYPRAYGLGGASMDFATKESAPSPAIEAGSQDIISNVTLRYEIK